MANLATMLTSKTLICSLFLLISIVSSARNLDEAIPPVLPQPDPIVDPPTATVAPVAPTEPAAPVVAPVAPTEPAAPVVAPVPDPPAAAIAPPIKTPTNAAAASEHPLLSFFMHDILGGSKPSGRVVTGVVASSDASTLPFSVPNNQIFPLDGGVPLNTINGVVNDNNYPFLVGLNGGVAGAGTGAGALLQSNGNNVQSSNDNQPFVTAGQLPQGLTIQQLMFGSLTVVDNEITEGHELGTAVLGRMQGFYIASSSDGSAHTLALTALFHGGEHNHHEEDDTVSFFGIHRTATPVSHIAVIGGTGRYENAKGYATIETLPHFDQHTTDGVETVTHFTLYITP